MKLPDQFFLLLMSVVVFVDSTPRRNLAKSLLRVEGLTNEHGQIPETIFPDQFQSRNVASRPSNNLEQTTRATNNFQQQPIRPTNNNQQATRPTNNIQQTSRPTNNKKQATRPAINNQQATGATNNIQQTGRPTNNIQPARPTNNVHQATRPTNNRPQATRPTNNGTHLFLFLQTQSTTSLPTTTRSPTSTLSSVQKPVRQPGCTQLPDPGECKGAFPRFYYNPWNDQCDCFFFGGCDEEGVVFSWLTLDECLNACVPANTTQGEGCQIQEVVRFSSPPKVTTEKINRFVNPRSANNYYY